MKFQMCEKLVQEAKDTDRTEDDKLHENDLATNAKLPKLIITKFKGTHLDWKRFWNQFKAEIDSANIPQITKFSYLKEMCKVGYSKKCRQLARMGVPAILFRSRKMDPKKPDI